MTDIFDYLDDRNRLAPKKRYAPERTSVREHAFRNTWLPSLHPNTDFSAMQFGLLLDLYPRVWQYGPRGDIFQDQITEIDLLVNTVPEYADTPRLNALLQSISPFVRDFKKLIKNGNPQVDAISAAEQRPFRASGWITVSDHYFDIMLSDTLTYAEEPVKDKGEDLLITLGYLSLHKDLFEQVGDMKTVTAYTAYCERWGIPA